MKKKRCLYSHGSESWNKTTDSPQVPYLATPPRPLSTKCLFTSGVILFVFMGAWLGGGVSLGSWVTVLLFGVIGYVMKVSGWARPPLILGLILGTIVENRFLLSTGAYDGFGWLAKPLVLFLLILVLVTVFLAVRGFKGRRGYANSRDEQGEGRVSNPVMSLPFSLVLVSCFVYATITAAEWPEEVGLFPTVVAVPGLMLAGIALSLIHI